MRTSNSPPARAFIFKVRKRLAALRARVGRGTAGVSSPLKRSRLRLIQRLVLQAAGDRRRTPSTSGSALPSILRSLRALILGEGGGGLRKGEEDLALIALLKVLKAEGYAFVTPTPSTHERVLRRKRPPAEGLRDALGWSLPFYPGGLDPQVEELLRRGGALEERGALVRSSVRVSSVAGELYLHSAYPTSARDAVFLGPDSSRFVRLIRAVLETRRENLPTEAAILDLGAGSGVGALAAADLAPGARLVLADLNPRALRYAAINARAQGRDVETVIGEAPAPGETFDVVLANPPFLLDGDARLYRDGGGDLGEGASLAMARTALERLAPDGVFVLYTGAAIREGRDPLRTALQALAGETGRSLDYEEIDPDIFGEELERPAYASVERIAAVGAVFSRARRASSGFA